MFIILRRLCNEKNIPIDNFWANDESLAEEEAKILLQLALEINWKRNRKLDLLKRIRRIARKTSFSVRETRFLGKLVKQQIKEGYQDFRTILDYFPGKTFRMVRDHYKKHFGDRR